MEEKASLILLLIQYTEYAKKPQPLLTVYWYILILNIWIH